MATREIGDRRSGQVMLFVTGGEPGRCEGIVEMGDLVPDDLPGYARQCQADCQSVRSVRGRWRTAGARDVPVG